MKPFSKNVVVAFGISALASFTLLFAQRARASSTVTMPGRNCIISGGGTVCSVPGGSAIAIPGGIAHVYFDFISTGNNLLIANSFYKQTYTGTLYSDGTSGFFSAGTHETHLVPQQVNVSVSQWDYFYCDFVGAAGSGMTTLSNIIGVGVAIK